MFIKKNNRGGASMFKKTAEQFGDCRIRKTIRKTRTAKQFGVIFVVLY